jgi:hypothetical protein
LEFTTPNGPGTTGLQPPILSVSNRRSTNGEGNGFSDPPFFALSSALLDLLSPALKISSPYYIV